ncbi:hypothetical protein BST97_05655 [Nonlabens spongiae]|uniref:Uncharacterized protein n=1 Tax=Nonlabens spongiae TaxID=331648 RepID=A0A1W6MJ66_9FLAO|nr:hypothetical protein BST97_05655 [Nonlabens spongiae]
MAVSCNLGFDFGFGFGFDFDFDFGFDFNFDFDFKPSRFRESVTKKSCYLGFEPLLKSCYLCQKSRHAHHRNRWRNGKW